MASGSSHLAYPLLLAAFLVMFLTIAPAMAALTLTGVKYMADVAPGATVTYSMTLSSAASDAASDYEASVLGFGNGADGNYLAIEPAKDTGTYTARPFITLDKTAVHIAPGGKEVITATIQVPSGGAGGRYALINIHPKQVTTTGTVPSFSTAMNVPVMITLKGTQLTETGIIESISAGDAVAGTPLQIQTTLKNTGNHHYYGAFVNVTITDSTGRVVATTSTSPSIFALIPGNEMTLKAPINVALTPGTYTVKSEAKIPTGMVLLDSKTVSIPIGISATPTATGEQTPAGSPTSQATPASETTIALHWTPPATPTETGGQHKIPFLPIYTPGPDALITIGVLSAALLLWSGRRRK